MIVLVSGATRFERSEAVGHLIVPRQWNNPKTLDLTKPYAFDNGCFGGFDHLMPVSTFDPGAYMRMLQIYAPHMTSRCLFAAAPDVVGDAAATFDAWPFWSRVIQSVGIRPAFVAQDGVTAELLPNLIGGRGALFIGGTTKFKESAQVRTLCGYAKARDIWVHWGRVNGKRRYELALIAGADSFDGTGFSRHSNINIPKVAQWQQELDAQPCLLDASSGR